MTAPLTDAWLDELAAVLHQSGLLRRIAQVRDDGGRGYALGSAVLRPLTAAEVQQLESQGNDCDDWSRVRVADGFDARRVRRCSFQGEVVLGRFSRRVAVAGGAELPAGVYQATVADCVIGHDALVRDVRLLSNYVVGEGVRLLNCGTVTCDAGTAFGNGRALPVGVETGGRDVRVFADISLALAAAVARSRGDKDLLQRYAAWVEEYRVRATSPRGVLEPGAAVYNTPKIHNLFLGAGARVDGAQAVENSTILSEPSDPARIESGAVVSESLLQWGSHVSSAAVVDRSVLIEHAAAERHAKVTNSIVGPNTAVGAGEVTSSLVGPFVGFHHQALLIGAVWPEGKGNVAYGANVGSNHTIKAPDQEFFPGEGLFLGLGVNVKYPADFTRSPYTAIACGVNTLPQQVAFPFALVTTPAVARPGVPPAYNEIIPAWMLLHNAYALRRNEEKFRDRNRARRESLILELWRPEIVDLVRDACRRLEAVSRPRDVYTDKDIPGLGKNYLCEEHRRPALTAYRVYTQLYALLGLKAQAELGPELLYRGTDPRSPSERWEHQRRVLHDDFGLRDVREALSLLPDLLEQAARAVEDSRGKDDARGPRIIADYAAVHAPAAEDPVVLRTWAWARRLQAEVRALLAAAEPARGGAAAWWPADARPCAVG
jgi:hypothetical protein